MQAIILKLRKSGLFNNVSISDELRLQKTLEETNNLVSVVIDEKQTIHIVCEQPNKFLSINNGENTFFVRSAYFNGLSDRTTYNGTHRGNYDNPSYEDALKIAIERCEGKYKVIEVFNNLQKELKFIPMKYRKMLCMGSGYESKAEGYWLYLKNGYITENGHGCQTIHEYTQKDVLAQLRQVIKK